MQQTPDGLQLAQQAHADFDHARRRAFLSAVTAALHRRPNWLLSYADIERQVPMYDQHYRGVQAIPLAAVRGSVDRYHDFDRNFLPRQTHTRARWESVDRANLSDVSLPAIEVYKVGEVYFVKDGNHRVSVARQRGMEFIDAEVIETESPLPLEPDTDPRDLLRLAEHVRFQNATHLDVLRPATVINFSTLGSYDRLLDHIRGHQWLLGVRYGREFSWEEAVQSWHDLVYAPLAHLIAEHGILDAFPGRTPADLYLWIVEHGYYLSLAEGREFDPGAIVESFARQRLGWGRRLLRGLFRLGRRSLHALTATFHWGGPAL